jgi:hypothetical protein
MSRRSHIDEAGQLLTLAAGFDPGDSYTESYLAAALVNAGLAIAERLDTANLIQAYALNITAHSPQQYEDARAQILARLNNQTTQGE